MQPTYTIFAGVNGSGKSTLYNTPYIYHDNLGFRINSDEILVANGQDKRMKCYTPPLAKISFFKKPIPALKIPQGSY